MLPKPLLIRVTTVPISMNHIMRGQLKFMSQFYNVIGISSYVKKDVDDILNREEIKMHFIEMHRTIHPIKDLIALIKLTIIFLKLKPNIVHTHTPKAGLLGMLAAFFAGVPIRLHTVAGMPLAETTGWKRKLLLTTEKLTYKAAHKIYPNSTALAQFILQESLTHSKKVKVLGKGSSNGINLNFFSRTIYVKPAETIANLRQELGILPNDFVFIFIGRLAVDKGINELIAAFKQISTNHKDTKLLLIGPLETANGKLSDEVISEMKSHPNIIYPGRAEDIRPYLLASNCFVFPSYREGFPGVLMQAGAMEVPIIATNIGGNNQLVQHKKNGLLFEPKDYETLLKTMHQMLNFYEEGITFAQNMLSDLKKNFANDIVWQALKTEYNYFLNTPEKK